MKKKILSLALALVMVFGVFLPVAAVPETAVTANAATCPIEGATGAGTETDPVIVDNALELKKALEYSGTLYIVLNKISGSYVALSEADSFADVSSKKVLTLNANVEFRQLNPALSHKISLIRVLNGGDLTITADSHRTIKYTYTVVEAYQANAKVTLKGGVVLETTHNDKADVYSYALRCHTGNTFIENAELSSAQFVNNAATIKNVKVTGNVALKGTAFTVWPGSIGYLGDKDQTFLACPDFGANVTYRKELQVRCVGGFQTQSPAMPEGKTTAAQEKVFLGMDKVYEFSTPGNPGWSMDQKYSPYGSLLIIDSSNGIVWSAQDDDVGNFDSNVSLSVNLKDKIKTPGKYKIREVITLKKDGNEVKKLVHEFPVEVVEFKEFLGQSPKMPAGKTEFFLGTISQKSYPVTFYSHSLSQSMIDEGYKSIAKLQIYTVKDNRYVYGEKAYCEKGQKINYDLNKLPADAYYFVETIELRDKNNKVVQSAVNMFVIDWIPQVDIKEVNISANWQGTISAPVSNTKGVKIVSYKWEKWDGSNWKTLNTSTPITGGGRYRCMVELAAETGYKLASSYTVKIGGVAAKKYSGSADLWYVARDITGYLSTIEIEDICLPEAGAYPVFDGYDIQSAQTNVKLVEWYKCDKDGKKLGEPLIAADMFEKDSYYRLEVTVAPATGYEFDSTNTGFYINGDKVNYNSLSGSYTGYKVYHVDDVEGTFKLYLYNGGKDVIIKNGQYIASDSSVPSLKKPAGGYAYYKDGVLTLYAYNNEKAHFVFEEGNLDVYLRGRNRIGAISNSEFLGELKGLKARKGNLTIDAEAKASLVVTSNPLDAYCNIFVNTLTFNGGKVISLLANGTYGAALWAEKLIVADGYAAYVGETNDFDSATKWNPNADIKNYKNVWLDVDSCRHDMVKYEKTEATCISEGCKETFEVCEKCCLYVVKEDGTVLTGDEAAEFYLNSALPKTDHNYKLHKKQAATCTADGAKYDYYTCDVCDGIFSASKAQISELTFKNDIFIAKFSHKLTAVGANPATCTTDGNIAHYKCTRENCGMLFSDSEGKNEITTVKVPATGHNLQKVAAVKPTCTANGTVEHYKCTVCGKLFSDAEGKNVITDVIAKAPGHTAGNWQVKVAAQVGKKGTEVKKCTVCNAELETRDIPALTPSHTHTLVLVKNVPATCTANGTIEHYKCSGCAKLFSDAAATKEITDSTVKATGHSYEWVVTKPAQVGVAGEQAYTCKVCKTVKEKKPIAALEAEYMLGDVDFSKKVDATDARLALRAAVGLDKLSDTAKKAADVDKNNAVDATDARIILRVAVGLDKLN